MLTLRRIGIIAVNRGTRVTTTDTTTSGVMWVKQKNQNGNIALIKPRCKGKKNINNLSWIQHNHLSKKVRYIWTLLNSFDLKDLKDAWMNNRYRLKSAFNCDNEIILVMMIPHVKWEIRRIDSWPWKVFAVTKGKRKLPVAVLGASRAQPCIWKTFLFLYPSSAGLNC